MNIWVMDSTGKPAAEFLDYKAARDYCIEVNSKLPMAIIEGEQAPYYIDRYYEAGRVAVTEAVARGWCHQDQEHPGREMDAFLAEAITDEVTPLVAMPTARIKELEAGIEELYEEIRGLRSSALDNEKSLGFSRFDSNRFQEALQCIQSELGVPGEGPSPHPQGEIVAANTCIYNAFDIATAALDYWKDAEGKGAETQAIPAA